jgi:hypothetical protein
MFGLRLFTAYVPDATKAREQRDLRMAAFPIKRQSKHDTITQELAVLFSRMSRDAGS